MQDLIDRLLTKSKKAMSSEEEIADLARLREEWETARQCIDICSKADTHLKENASTIENYATGDETIQFLVSTDGKTVHGKNQGFGWRTRQVGGHFSDTSLQQLSRDISSISFQKSDVESPSSQGRPPAVPDDGPGNGLSSKFDDQYGQGFKLTSKSHTEVARPLKGQEKTG
jgi:hypothetical protein